MALDQKGIYLSEVNRRYPQSFQVLGYDSLMDVDSMYKPKMISTFEMCINSILTLLFMKPGQYPSIPELGIDIESYLHEYSDDPSVPQKIKNMLNDQCNRIEITGIKIDCEIDTTDEGVDALIITITGDDRLCYGLESNTVLIGISYDKLNRLYIRKHNI